MKVIEAKKLLAQGKAASSTKAAEMVGISRSAFYKYKDSIQIYNSGSEDNIVTYYLALSDTPGVLSAVLAKLSKVGANILTINQNIPVDSVAPVSISFRTGSLKIPEKMVIGKLKAIDGVVEVKSLMSR